MLKVKINDDVFNVLWEYTNPKPFKKIIGDHLVEVGHAHSKQLLDKDKPLITTCRIVKRIEKGKHEEIVSAIIRKHPNDEWNREKAREFSLRKALFILYPNMDEPKFENCTLEDYQEDLKSVRAYNDEQGMKREPYWNAYRMRGWKSLTEKEMFKDECKLLDKLVENDKLVAHLTNNKDFILAFGTAVKEKRERLALQEEEELITDQQLSPYVQGN